MGLIADKDGGVPDFLIFDKHQNWGQNLRRPVGIIHEGHKYPSTDAGNVPKAGQAADRFHSYCRTRKQTGIRKNCISSYFLMIRSLFAFL